MPGIHAGEDAPEDEAVVGGSAGIVEVTADTGVSGVDGVVGREDCAVVVDVPFDSGASTSSTVADG